MSHEMWPQRAECLQGSVKASMVHPVHVAGNIKICQHLDKVLTSQVCRTKCKNTDHLLSLHICVAGLILLACIALEVIPNTPRSISLPIFLDFFIFLFSHYLCTFFQVVLEHSPKSFCFKRLVLALHWNNYCPIPAAVCFSNLTQSVTISCLSIKCLSCGRHWHKLRAMFGLQAGIRSRFYKWKQVFSYCPLLLHVFLSNSTVFKMAPAQCLKCLDQEPSKCVHAIAKVASAGRARRSNSQQPGLKQFV